MIGRADLDTIGEHAPVDAKTEGAIDDDVTTAPYPRTQSVAPSSAPRSSSTEGRFL